MLWNFSVLKAISDFIVGSFLSIDSFNFEYVLSVLEFSHFWFYVCLHEFSVYLLFCIIEIVLAELLSVELFFLEGEVQFSESLICNDVYGLSVFHDTSDEQLVEGKLVDFG